MRDRGEVEHRVLLHHAVIADVFAVRTFRLDVALGIEIALQHVFGVGRNVDVVGDAFDDRHWLAAQRAQYLQFVDRRIHTDRRHEIARRRADHIGDRRLFSFRHRFQKDRAGVARRDHVDAGGARAAQHDATAADVGVAAVAELHDIEAGRDIRRAVLAVLQMHRQCTEVRCLAFQHNLLNRRVLGRESVKCKHQHHRNQQEAEHGLPAEMLGDRRREHRIDDDAHVARARDAHHDALILRRVPAARLRQRDGERCATDAERETENLDRKLAVEPVAPHPGGGRGHDDLRDHAGSLGADDIGEDTHRHAQQRAGQNRNRHQRELLADREVHVVRDVDHQRAQRDPGHETDVEVQERGQQRRPMTCLPEFSKLHCG